MVYNGLFVILAVAICLIDEGKKSLAIQRTALERRAPPRCPDGRCFPWRRGDRSPGRPASIACPFPRRGGSSE